MKVALLHVSDPELFGNPLALGYLKTYADSVLGGRADISIHELLIGSCLRAPAAEARRIKALGAGVAAFSCYMWNIDAVLAVCRALRRCGWKGRIVLGGPDAAGRGHKLLREGLADAVAEGEGELTFADLLERLLDGRGWAGVPGAVTLEGGRISKGPARPYIKDLSVIPSPYLSGLFEDRKYRYYVFETSRGCPFKCLFCTWTGRSGLRNFPVKRAVAEARLIASKGEKFSGFKAGGGYRDTVVFVTDSDIITEPGRAVKIFDAVRGCSAGRKLTWIVNCGLRGWTPEVAAAADSGHFEFGLSLESTDPALMAAVGRCAPSRRELDRALDTLKRHAPKARLLLQLMLGIPGDTVQGFMRSLRWSLEACGRLQPAPALAFAREGAGPEALKAVPAQVPRAAIRVFHTSVLPGSRLEKEAGRLGVEWGKRPPYPVLGFKGFTSADIDRCYEALASLAAYSSSMYGSPVVICDDIRRAA